MTRKAELPLVAALQTAPDASWAPILAQLDDARAAYDPVSQTGTHPLQTGECRTYRATSSGGTPALSAESDGQGKELPTAPAKPSPRDVRTYRGLSSGGSARLPDDGGKLI